MFKDIVEVKMNKKGELVVKDKAENTYIIPKEVEYFQEVGERITDVSEIQPNTDL